MKKLILLNITLLISSLFCLTSSFSQNTELPILLEIEDSLRGRLQWGFDSTWLNSQLNFKKVVSKTDSLVGYKLVKIDRQNFTEGPHAELSKKLDSNKYPTTEYGDSYMVIGGQQHYTYIGNSSWGYYDLYVLIRKDKQPILKYQHWEPPTCEHGWDVRRGQPCSLCMNGIKLKQDSNNKESEVLSIDSLKKTKTVPVLGDVIGRKNSTYSIASVFQEHLVTNYRGSLKGFRTLNEDSIWLNKQLNFLRNGSDTDSLIYYELIEVKKIYFIENDTNPEFVSPKQNNPLKSPFSSGVKSKYGDSIIQFKGGKNYTAYGIPLKGYEVEYTLKRTSYLASYKFKNCSHSQVCCNIKCHQCEKPKPIILKKITFDSVPLMVINSDCAHGHDCCSMECECCSSLTKKKRKQLIRNKKKRHRKGQRATRRDERKKKE